MRFNLVLFLFSFSFISFSQESSQQQLETVLQNGHAKYLTCYDFSHDGKFIVTGGYDQKVLLWDLSSGKIIRSFSMHTGTIRSLEFSANDQQILTASTDNKAFLVETKSGLILREFKLKHDRLWEAHFNPQNTHVFLSDNRGVVQLNEISDHRNTVNYEKEYGAPVQNTLCSPVATKILSFGNYKGFYEFDYSTGDTSRYFEFDKARILSYSPKGKYIAASSRKLHTDVFDNNTGKLLYHLENNDEKCDGCNTVHAFADDESQIVTVSNKSIAVIWDLNTGKKIKSFETIDDSPTSVKISPDKSKLLIAYDKELHIYDTKSGKRKVSLESGYIDYYDFKFSADGQYIAFPGFNNEVQLINTNNGAVKKSFSGYLNVLKDDGTRFSYDSWGDKGILKYINRKREALFSPNNELIAISHIDSVALILEASTGRVLHTLIGHSQVVIGLDFSHDGQYLLTTSADRRIKIWEVKTGKLLKTLKGHREVVFDAVFSSDDKFIVSTSWDATLGFWDWQEDEYWFKDFGGTSPYSVGLSKNDLYVIAGNLGSQLQLFEFDSGLQAKNLVGHTSITSSIAFNEKNNDLISANWDGSVRAWEFNSGMMISKLKGFQGGAFAVEVDQNSGLVAAAGADKEIRIWNYQTNEVLTRLIGHNSAITGLCFSADGSTLLSMAEDGVMKLWNVKTGAEIYTRLQISRNEWLATRGNGFFDGSSKAIKNVNYVSGNEVLPVNSFFKKYYSPGLIERVNKGESFDDRGEHFEKAIQSAPDLELLLSSSYRSMQDLSSGDTLKEWADDEISLDLKINSNGISLSDIRVYNNGKLVFNEALEKDIVFRAIESDNKKVTIELNDGLNNIQAVAINKEGVESIPVNLFVNKTGLATPPNLYVLTIGINDYKNPNYHLNYAVNDAQSFSNSLSDQTTGLFGKIITENISDEDAIKGNIKTKLDGIKEKIKANDVFVFFYAGHGVLGNPAADGSQEFYMVLQDLTNLYGGAEELNSKGLSASELFEYSLNISAQKQLFVIDACHSGGALNSIAQRGAEREKIIAQLARSSGSYFLTASQSSEYANEAGNLNHGLFTYAILEVLNGEDGNGDNKITVGEIKSYVEQRVPVLSEEHQGTPQYPTGYAFGQDFPLVLSK